MCDVRAADVRAETDWHARGRLPLRARRCRRRRSCRFPAAHTSRAKCCGRRARKGRAGEMVEIWNAFMLLEERDHFIRLAARHARWSRRRFAARPSRPPGLNDVRRDDHAEQMCLVARGLDSSGCMRSTPGSPTTSASSTPVIINDEVGLFGGDLFDERRGLFGGVRLVGERTRHVACRGRRLPCSTPARAGTLPAAARSRIFVSWVGDAADCGWSGTPESSSVLA